MITLIVEACAMAIFAWPGRDRVLARENGLSRPVFAAAAGGFALALNAASHPFFVFWFPHFHRALGTNLMESVLAAEALIVFGEGLVYFAAMCLVPGHRSATRLAIVGLIIAFVLNVLSYGVGAMYFSM